MFSKNLKLFRLKKQLSKKALAEKIGLSARAYSLLEDGKQKPSIEILEKLAKVLEVQISDFLRERNLNLNFKHGEICYIKF